jgi:hypothetical protein
MISKLLYKYFFGTIENKELELLKNKSNEFVDNFKKNNNVDESEAIANYIKKFILN